MAARRRQPTTDQPLNAEKRPRFSPILAVVALVVVVAVIFLVLTWVQQNT
jgi:hypothetical protein